jgi:hypothetical protein
MRDSRDSRIRTLIVILIALLALAYLYFVAPGYNANISDLRMQSKLMQFDIDAINEMAGDDTILNRDIETSTKSLDDIKNSASLTADDVELTINSFADKAKVSVISISTEGEPDNPIEGIKAQHLTVTATGDYKQGASFMNLIEESAAASFAVESFAYTGTEESGNGASTDTPAQAQAGTSAQPTAEEAEEAEPEPTWIFSLILYYFEQT